MEKKRRKKRRKKKSIVSPYAYNLNDFPDEVLGRIISFLPTKEAVRTSVLSRRWRYLFTLLSNFNLIFVEEEKKEFFLNFVDRLLLHNLGHQKPSIVRFRLQCRRIVDPKRVLLWVYALVEEHKIEELELCMGHRYPGIGSHEDEEFGLYPLLASLFSRESLVVLKLELHSEYNLKVPTSICLPNLKVICLKDVWFSKDDCEGRLFSNCPMLEDLVFDGCCFRKGCSKFSISNQNIKKLTLRELETTAGSIVPIMINAPSLEYLSYTLDACLPLVLLDVTSLAKAYFDGAKDLSELEVNAAADVLRGIQNIVTLEIHNSIIREIHRYNVRIPLFDKMTWLKLCGWGDLFDPVYLEYFLARCVALETLVMVDVSVSSPKRLDTGIQYSLRKSALASLLDRLKKIEIEVTVIEEDQDEDVLTVIEFFLKNATVLKEVKIAWRRCCIFLQHQFMAKLLSFPRISSKCKVEFYNQNCLRRIEEQA